MKRRFITFGRIIRTGIVNFFRNASLAIAAVAVMVVTLTIILISLLVNVTLTNEINRITDKIQVSVYLKEEVTPQQTTDLRRQIEALPNTSSTDYLTREQALQAFRDDSIDDPALQSAITQTDNPLPATIRVKLVDLNKVQEVQNFLKQPKVQALQSAESSYNGDRKEAIDNISKAANTLQKVGVISVAMFTIVSVLIIFNTIQMAIFNRRDEISIMRLLGANTTFIRGPFIVESIIYGIVAGAISIGLIHLLFVASASTLQASSLGLLDISYAQRFFNQHFPLLLAIQLGAGVVIGAISSFIATRRYLKFKVSK